MPPVVLCILDGWGLSPAEAGNAPRLARTPVMDALWAGCPHARLVTHGRDAGLPTGQMGNSEVGHTNIGAGRVVAMDLGQIDLAVEDGSFGTNPALLDFIETLKGSGGTAHLMGVVSDGGVHGSLGHLIAAIRSIAEAGVPVAIHAITDGRDVAPGSAPRYLAQVEAHTPANARIATVIGRYWAMDRDNRWERVKTAFDAIVLGQGRHAPSAQAAVAEAASRGESDEFVAATVIGDYAGLTAADGLLCLNFRADRAREILAALSDPSFGGWDRGEVPMLAARLGMVSYSSAHDAWFPAMFPKRQIANTLGEWVSAHGLRQFRLAETEKYPHVTFFLNGGVETPYPGEDRHMPPSPKVATYDLAPEMSAAAVTDALVGAIGAGSGVGSGASDGRGDGAGYGLIVVNYANPDMVGHTGSLPAAIAACEAVDAALGRALAALAKAGGAMLVIADHGNCEVMIDPVTGAPHTAHTTNPVPAILVGAPPGTRLRDGRLADVAPTVLGLMGLPLPPEMTGTSLIDAAADAAASPT